MSKKIPTKKSAGPAPATKSKLTAGSGSNVKANNRLVVVYSPPKMLKTSALAKLPLGKTKWIASDPNCIPALQSLDLMPHPDDLYEFRRLEDLRAWLEEALTLAETEGPEALGIEHLVVDSATQYSDWYQADIAKETGQKFLGDNKDDNGWQAFNAMFGGIIDLLAALKRYINVYVICHAAQKFDRKKGEYSGFNLSPKMSEKLGRSANWILYKTMSEVIDEDEKKRILEEKADSPWYIIVRDSDEPDNIELTRVFLNVFHTRPYGNWFASVERGPLAAEEPGTDITLLLKKAGLMDEDE